MRASFFTDIPKIFSDRSEFYISDIKKFFGALYIITILYLIYEIFMSYWSHRLRRLILTTKLNVNVEDDLSDIFEHENKLLFYTIYGKKSRYTIKQLLSAGANPNISSKRWDITALGLASYVGKWNIVKQLLKAGADVNGLPYAYGVRDTALHIAVRERKNAHVSDGCLKTTLILLKFGININAENSYHKTALNIAIENNDTEVVNLLLKAGANLSFSYMQFLPYIVVSSDINIIECILKHITENGVSAGS